jgi:hypothetical protein
MSDKRSRVASILVPIRRRPYQGTGPDFDVEVEWAWQQKIFT